MFSGLKVVAECYPGVMRGLFVIARFVVLRRFTMMFGGLLIVLGRVLVKLVDLMLRHFVLPELLWSHQSRQRDSDGTFSACDSRGNDCYRLIGAFAVRHCRTKARRRAAALKTIGKDSISEP
jgi:hypothetical protein